MDKKERKWLLIRIIIAIIVSATIATVYLYMANIWMGLLQDSLWMVNPTKNYLDTTAFIYGSSVFAISILFHTAWIIYFYQKNGTFEIKRKTSNSISADKSAAQKKRISAEYLSTVPDGWTFGKIKNRYVRLPINQDNITHSLIVGSPGSWKSTTILNGLIYNFNCTSPAEKMTVFAIDVKPELMRKSAIYTPDEDSGIRCVDPSSISKYYTGWDAYYGLDRESSDDEAEHRMDLIAHALISYKVGGDNEIFYQHARNMLVGLLLYEYFRGLGFIDAMLRISTIPLQDYIAEVLQDREIILAHPKLRAILGGYDGDTSEMIKNCESTMRTDLRIFSQKSVQFCFRDNKSKASPIDLINGNSIFYCLPDYLQDEYRPISRLITTMVLNYLSSVPEESRSDSNCPIIWLLIDEFGSMGPIPGINSALARIRSRKVSIWLCVQGLSQLDETYGQAGRRSIVSNCETTLVLSCKDDLSGKYFSELAGNYQETKISQHRNGITGLSNHASQNISTEYRPIFDISDLSKLRRDKMILAFVEGGYIYCNKCPFFRIPEYLQLSNLIKSENDRIKALYGKTSGEDQK